MVYVIDILERKTILITSQLTTILLIARINYQNYFLLQKIHSKSKCYWNVSENVSTCTDKVHCSSTSSPAQWRVICILDEYWVHVCAIFGPYRWYLLLNWLLKRWPNAALHSANHVHQYDVIRWKHFQRYRPFERGIQRVTSAFTAQK